MASSSSDACAAVLLEAVPAMMQALRIEMRGACRPQLTVPQFRTLAMVAHHPGSSLGDAAAHVGLGAPAMSVLVDGLVRRGLLRREPATGDRRRLVLALTPAGTRLLDRARAVAQRRFAARLAALDGKRLVAVHAAARALRELFADAVPRR